MNKVFKTLKNNVVYIVVIILMLTAIGFLVAGFLSPVFVIDYYQGGFVENDVLLPLVKVATHHIDGNFIISSLPIWFAKGSKMEYHMLIQMFFLVFAGMVIATLCLITSLVLNLIKDKFSKKVEFVSGTFGIVAAILGFATVMFLIISLTTTNVVTTTEFTFNSHVSTSLPGYYFFLVSAFLFVLSGAILAAASNEKLD